MGVSIPKQISKYKRKNSIVELCCHSQIKGILRAPSLSRVLVGKEFNNVCRTAIRFTNPDNYEFGVIKELVKARMQDIEVNYD